MEPIAHFVLPLVALLLLGIKLRTAAPLALLGLLPDIDSLFLIHRSYTHSLLITAVIFTALLLAVRHFKPDHQKFVVLGFLVVASHILLDLGALTPIFWPVYPYDISVKYSMNLVLGNDVSLTPQVRVAQALTEFKKVSGLDYPLLTEEGILLAAVLLLPVIYNYLRSRKAPPDPHTVSH